MIQWTFYTNFIMCITLKVQGMPNSMCSESNVLQQMYTQLSGQKVK